MAQKRGRKLDECAEDVITDLCNGLSYYKIGEKYNVSPAAVSEWVNEGEYSARARSAITLSAQYWDYEAERVLLEAKDPVEIARARELAQHYRKRSAVRDKKGYSEKIELDATVKKEPIDISELTDEQRLVITKMALDAHNNNG